MLAGCGLAVLTIGLITTGPWARHTADLVAAGFGRGDADATDTAIEPAA